MKHFRVWAKALFRSIVKPALAADLPLFNCSGPPLQLGANIPAAERRPTLECTAGTAAGHRLARD